jgi:DNA (cytosine-5)-methyltransferase 1
MIKDVTVQKQLVLSLSTGVGLLDKPFKELGFVVVSAGDIIYNIDGDMRDFTGIKNKFDGIIAGIRCQDFSKANRDCPVVENSEGYELLQEFKRIVLECRPSWCLLENVERVPDLKIDGYTYQRIDINQSWYEDVNRLRHIQFYSKIDNPMYLHFDRGVTVPGHKSKKYDPAALASDSRTFKELLKLQGLSSDINFLDFTVKGKKKLIGNGVPLSMGRVLAKSVLDVTVPGHNSSCDFAALKRCKCDCKRIVTHQGKFYDYSCRKRYGRKIKKESS